MPVTLEVQLVYRDEGERAGFVCHIEPVRYFFGPDDPSVRRFMVHPTRHRVSSADIQPIAVLVLWRYLRPSEAALARWLPSIERRVRYFVASGANQTPAVPPGLPMGSTADIALRLGGRRDPNQMTRTAIAEAFRAIEALDYLPILDG